MDRNHRIPPVYKDKASIAMAELLPLFKRCGYIRRCDSQLRESMGQAYRKGCEIRFVLDSEDALQVVRRLLKAAKLRPGRPFRKHRRIVQPVYGRKTVELLVKRLRKGRTLAKHGFGPDGRRIIRRPTIPNRSPLPERPPNRALPPANPRKRRAAPRRAAKAARG